MESINESWTFVIFVKEDKRTAEQQA